MKYFKCLVCVASLLLIALAAQADERTDAIATQCDRLDQRIDGLRNKLAPDSDLVADVAIYSKAIRWALKYDKEFNDADLQQLKKAIEGADQRIVALETGQPRWATRKGKVVRAFVSKVDDSVQPYGLIIPDKYDSTKPIRLDVVLHGSSKPVGMSELRFMGRFENSPDEAPPDVDYIELHPLGRVENCYRWSGETDVFEAIESVCRNYNIDRDRIVLRGMSMGASGTWHLGLKHPDRFVALGPYCGYVDTHEFSHTPLPNFIPVDALPEHQEKALHMLDSIDYAANVGMVPAIACMGEKDIFFQAHVLMEKAMKREGLALNQLISPGTGHVIDPVTHQAQMQQIGDHAKHGINHSPKHIRFVTWTLKYNRCHWIQILGMDEHYARSEVEADMNDDGLIDLKEPINVNRIAIRIPSPAASKAKLRIAGKEIFLPDRIVNSPSSADRAVVLARLNGTWGVVVDPHAENPTKFEKRPGLQGPIDDAFTSRFLCVRGTGMSKHFAIQKWCDDRLDQFQKDWHRYFRGEILVKNDVDVTEEDMQSCNLVLFGDADSNRIVGQVLRSLPIQWSEDDLEFQGLRLPSDQHVPVLVHPNPLAPRHYVVLNSGHSFGDAELGALNYLLFPRLGDWAVFNVSDNKPLKAGFFNEQWR